MNKKNLVAFLVAFLLLIAVVIMDRVSFSRMRNYTEDVDRTREVITSFQKLSTYLKSSEVYSAKYAELSQKKFYSLYKKDLDNIKPELLKLRSLIGDGEPQQIERIDTLEGLINSQFENLSQNNVTQTIEAGEAWRLDTLFEIHNIVNRGIETESTLLNKRKQQLERSAKSTGILTIVFSVIAITLIVTTFFVNLYLDRKRRWLEGFLESILDTSRSGIVTYKAIRDKDKVTDFRIEFANTAAADLAGIKANEIIGKKLSEIPSYAQDKSLIEKCTRVVETGNQEQFEMLYNQQDKPVWLSVLLARLEDGVTASFHNITETKKYEEELQSNIKLLAESNKELEQYAYVASHDLQEPLRKIIIYAGLLNNSERNKLDEKAVTFLDKIAHAATRMSSLIYGILNFSSVKREDSFLLTDLNQVLHNVLDDLEMQIEQSKAVIQKETLPVVEAIPLQITQLFHNIISNALKFTRQVEAPLITIKSSELKREELDKYRELNKGIRHYCIIITDNGIGFKQQYADQIFGMFKRLNDKQLFPGSGIGLALCRKVVGNHNGVIIAKGTEGAGASFHIVLPERQLQAQVL
jgi:PAS domain S-box-containing protein